MLYYVLKALIGLSRTNTGDILNPKQVRVIDVSRALANKDGERSALLFSSATNKPSSYALHTRSACQTSQHASAFYRLIWYSDRENNAVPVLTTPSVSRTPFLSVLNYFNMFFRVRSRKSLCQLREHSLSSLSSFNCDGRFVEKVVVYTKPL